MDEIKMTFSHGAVYIVLAAFGIVAHADGFLYHKGSMRKVLSNEGIPIQLCKFGGVKMDNNGEPVFLINDLYTTMLLAEDKI